MPTRILLADDNPLFRTALRQVLQASDSWEIIETCDGQEAITTAVATRPDLIILDLAMPVKDGLAAAREISTILPDIPILMCTLHASPPIELEARKCGIRQLVLKSESIEIIAAIRQLVSKAPSLDASAITVLPEIALPASETVPVLPSAQAANKASLLESASAPIDPSPEKIA